MNKIEFGFYLAIFLLPVEAIQGKYLKEIHTGKTIFLLFIAAIWLIGYLFVTRNRTRKTSTQNNSLTISAIFFLFLITAFSIINSVETVFVPSIRAVLRLGVYIIAFCLIMPRVFSDKEKFLKIVKFIFVVAFLHSVFAYYQLIGSYFLKIPTLLRDAYDTNISLGLTRPHGVMSEPMPFANFFFLPIFLALSLFIRKNKYFNIKKLSFLASIFLISCILTFSRGGWISLFVGMIVFLYINRNYLNKILRLVGKIVIVLILIFYLGFSFNSQIKEKFNNFVRFSGVHRAPGYAYRYEVGDRVRIANIALDIFSENPLGVGIRNYGFVLGEVTGKPGKITTTANSYLDILVELGLLGFFAFIGIALLLLRKARHFFRKTEDTLNKSLILGITCAFIASLVQLNFYYYWQEYDFWFGIGMFLAVLNIVTRSVSNSSKFIQSKNTQQKSEDTLNKARKKKVLFVHGGRGKGVSGAEYVSLNIAKILDEANFTPRVVCGEGEFSKLLEKENIERSIIPFEILPNKRKGWLGKIEFLIQLLFVIPKLIKEIKRKEIDIVHTTTRGGHVCGSIAGKISGSKVIMHMHDLPRNRHFYTFLGIVCCDRVIAISNSVKKIFTQNKFLKKFIEKKLVVIYNGIDLKKFSISKPSPEILDEFRMRDSYPIIGIIGQIIRWKGHLDLMEAAVQVKREFKDFKVLIVGEVQFFEEGQYIEKLKSYIGANNISNNVIFTGQREDIPEILSVCDILVSASHAEPFGLTIIEAMAKGKPVIATKAGGPEEIVINGETGILVPAQNSSVLYKAIISLAGDSELMEEYGSNGRKRVEKYFDISFFNEKILHMYNEVVNKS